MWLSLRHGNVPIFLRVNFLVNFFTHKFYFLNGLWNISFTHIIFCHEILTCKYNHLYSTSYLCNDLYIFTCVNLNYSPLTYIWAFFYCLSKSADFFSTKLRHSIAGEDAEICHLDLDDLDPGWCPIKMDDSFLCLWYREKWSTN